MVATRGTMSVTSTTSSPFTCPSPTRQQQATKERERRNSKSHGFKPHVPITAVWQSKCALRCIIYMSRSSDIHRHQASWGTELVVVMMATAG